MRKITLILSILMSVWFIKAQTPLFSENFDNVITASAPDENGNVANTKDLAALSRIDSALATTKGWVGTKVYLSNGKLKLGTATAMGSLTTPSIDLAGKSFTVAVDLSSWINTNNAADPGASIDILLDGVVVATIAYKTEMANYTTPLISTGTSTSKITFAAKANKNRFFIDNLKVSQVVTSVFSTPINEQFSAIALGSSLFISSIPNGSIVEIYSALGTKVQFSLSKNGEAAFSNLAKGLYIIRVGKTSQKVIL